ncbi:MAG: hypothetical protein ACRDD2_08925 [Sarcina sp.]
MKTEVFVITADSMAEMGRIAHSLGNRHLPAEFKEGKMLLQLNDTVEKILNDSAIKYSKEEVELEKPFRDIDMGHIH